MRYRPMPARLSRLAEASALKLLEIWHTSSKDVERGGHVGPPHSPGLAFTMTVLLTLLMSLGLTSAVAFADDSVNDKQLQIERQLGCPICTNLPLNICDNQICANMKGVIRQKLDAGESPSQIVDYF